jgi:glycine cleavage system regulatory protein
MSLGELNQPMAKNHIIVTATGADRPGTPPLLTFPCIFTYLHAYTGVMNDIAKLIVRHGGDVTESKMSRST